MSKYPLISTNPDVMGGVPCIRDVRIPVATVIKLCSQGCSTEKILELYPDLTKEDIRGALEYAAASVDQREIPLPA